ncbi:spermatogenesis-associated protein 2-like [Lethenteron reissneri]|uniref:spermatogenesis-associated protein 2-like n=1 Tax=Lethenteron reissneri TaxID=7753 RepID=UPI002AB5E138|nr:spermatogenesis-associated protein 2-like [Lethenteron reissneri]
MAPRGGTAVAVAGSVSAATVQRDLLFQSYARFHEARLSAPGGRGRRPPGDAADLRRDARSLLASREHAAAGGSGGGSGSGSTPPGLGAIARCLDWFETVSLHVFLYPWKKEFRQIKAFSGPFVYWVRGVLRKDDTERILQLLGFNRCPPESDGADGADGAAVAYERRGRSQPDVALAVAFDLFLAAAECRLMEEMATRAGALRLPLGHVVRERRRGTRGGLEAQVAALARAAATAEMANGDAGKAAAATTGATADDGYDDGVGGCGGVPSFHGASFSGQAVEAPEILPAVLSSADRASRERNDAAIAAALAQDNEDDVGGDGGGGGAADRDETILRPTPSLMRMSSSPSDRADFRGRFQAGANVSGTGAEMVARQPAPPSHHHQQQSASMRGNQRRATNPVVSSDSGAGSSGSVGKSCGDIGAATYDVCYRCRVAAVEKCHYCRNPLCESCMQLHACKGADDGASPKLRRSESSIKSQQLHQQQQQQQQGVTAAVPAKPSLATIHCGFCGDANGALNCRSCQKVTCQDCYVHYREVCLGAGDGRQHAFVPIGSTGHGGQQQQPFRGSRR